MSKSKKVSPKAGKKSIEDKYQKKNPHEHILLRPNMYIGSIKKITDKMWIFNADAKEEADPRIILKEISYVPGFYKICDEIYVNAKDRTSSSLKLKIPCTQIKINIDKKTGRITVWNNGDGIDIIEHRVEKKLVPTMIFSDLLAGTNFDDESKDRVTGGMNGLGAKLTNIYSTEFELETLDFKRGLKFYQKFSNNMYKIDKEVITDSKGAEPYTQVSFIADFAKFGIKGISQDMFNLLKKRAYDVAMNSGVKVYFNDKLIKENTLQKYAELYFPAAACEEDDMCPKVFDIKSNARWKVAVVFDKTNKFDHENISFVNGICTSSGGFHVDHVVSQITNRLKDAIAKKLKGIPIKPTLIKENLIFFVDAVIVEPEFDSQSKEKLKTSVKDFGSEYKLTETFYRSIVKTGIIDSIISKAESLANAGLNKTDGKKTETVRLDKLADAEWAGTAKSEQCRLFLTEGDSAKTMAMSGFNVIGRKKFGAFPLKGKLKNVMGENGAIDVEKMNKNEEIEAIKKIMGLKAGRVYESLKELRYGGIVILTDQDEDGYHIKGLLINFIHKFWPSLVKYEGFITCFPTPIAKASKGSGTKIRVFDFYSLPDLDEWKEKNNDGKGYDIKQYKGLGTSDQQEAQEYFMRFAETLVTYYCPPPIKVKDKKHADSEADINTEGGSESKKESSDLELTYKPQFKDPTTESISLAFDKKRADHRKIWMNAYDTTDHMDNSIKRIPYTEFFDKELRAFSISNAKRAVPGLLDGFKPSQRKIFFTCLLKNLYGSSKQIRVAQLSGAVSELANYHHGEASLQGAIVKMAQNYVGSNNLNLLHPRGQFGSRLEGGDDAASSRYIHTYLKDIGKLIFNIDDTPILTHQTDDGKKIEPEFYAPIIPMLLVNGTAGIGTGWSSDIEPCNPRDIVDNLRLILDGSNPKKMDPWYRYFTGQVEKIEPQKYLIRGSYEIIGTDTIHITDLPIGVWTENYKSFLNKLIDEAAEQTKADKATAKKQTSANTPVKGGKGGKGAKGAKAPAKGSKTAKKPPAKKGKKGANSRANKKKDASKSRTAKVAKSNTIGKYIKSFTESCTDVKVDITIVFHPGKLEPLLASGKLETQLKLSTTVKLSNMHAFDENGKIVKYESYGSILKAYAKVRLDLYQKRKDYLLDKWKKEMDQLQWKLKFIEGVISGEIVVFKNGKSKKKDQVHARLEELGFPKFYDNDKAKEPSYSYTDINIYKLTEEEVEKLRKEIEDRKTEIKALKGKTPTDLWIAELDDFMVAYDKWDLEETEAYEKLLRGNATKPKKKGAKKGSKKEEVEI